MLNFCDFIRVYVLTTDHHPEVNGYFFTGSNSAEAQLEGRLEAHSSTYFHQCLI